VKADSVRRLMAMAIELERIRGVPPASSIVGMFQITDGTLVKRGTPAASKKTSSLRTRRGIRG
jgi:hypothetical protein